MARRERVLIVYVMTGHNRRLYTGVTNDLERRVREHKTKALGGFTSRYNFHRLVYYEFIEGPLEAIAREKEIKGWRREKKLDLIESINPGWEDLSEGWFDEASSAPK